MPLLIDMLSTRSLVATVNDVSLNPPRTFFLDSLWPAPRQIFSETADIYTIKGSRGLAEFNVSGGAANIVGNIGTLIATVRLPIIREKKVMEARAITNPKGLGALYIENPAQLQRIQGDVIANDLRDLRNRQLRREEWMAAQLLTTGKIVYQGDRISFSLDFQLSSTHKPVLSGAALWSASTATVLTNLRAWSLLIQRAIGRPGRRVILGESAATAFLNNAEVMKLLDNNNLRVGSVTIDNSNILGSFGGFTFEVYSDQYADTTGTLQEMFPAAGALMLPDNLPTDRPYGLNEEMDEAGNIVTEPIFSKSWTEPDPSVRWILAAVRPLPIVTQADSWVYATVV